MTERRGEHMKKFCKQPYLQMPSAEGVTVMWETDEAGSSTVEVCRSVRKHTECVPGEPLGMFEGQPGKMHRVPVRGLEPGTDYHYRVISRSESGALQSDWNQFRTQGAAGTPFHFCVTSETGGYGGFHDHHFADATFAAIQTHRPDFLLFAGDMASNGRDWEDWNKYLFTPGASVLANTPFYLCPGNHEENTPLLAELFDFPQPCNYYSFDYGSAHFTVLDSTTLFRYEELPDGSWDALPTGELEEDSAQMRFLRSDLEQNAGAAWKFVLFHYPPFVSGIYEVTGMRRLCPLFEQYGVDIVFSSHTIVYERSHPIRQNRVDYDGGVTYVVAGGAGAMPDWFLHKQQWHTAEAAARPHVVQVSVAGNRLELKACDLAGCMFDWFVIQK